MKGSANLSGRRRVGVLRCTAALLAGLVVLNSACALRSAQAPVRPPIAMPPTPTFEPTLPAQPEQRMKGLLQDPVCRLPCYLGIVPGTTVLSEGKAILEGLNASYVGEYNRQIDNSIEYAYALVVGGVPGADETPWPNGSIVSVDHHVSLIAKNSVVQMVDVWAGTSGPGVSSAQAIAKFRDFWSRYTARGIFLQLGKPDALYIDEIDPAMLFYGRTIFMVYEKSGAVIELYGTGSENNVCPEHEARAISLHLTLYNPNSGLSGYSSGRTSQDLGLPIEKALGVGTEEFYNQVVWSPSACFKPQGITP